MSAYVDHDVFISVTHDVKIDSASATSMTAYAKNGSGGLIAKGDASATVNQSSNSSTAYVGSSTRIVAGGNFELSATTSSMGSSDGEAKAGGGIGLADGEATTTLNYETTASVHANADILAGGSAKVLADSVPGNVQWSVPLSSVAVASMSMRSWPAVSLRSTPCGPIEWFALPAGLAGVSVNVWTACAEPQSAARPVAWHLVSASLK